MFLLFRVGLEVNATRLMNVAGAALVVAAAVVISLSFAGWGVWVLWRQRRTESVFTGAAFGFPTQMERDVAQPG